MALAAYSERFQQLTPGIQAVPNAATDLSTKDSWIEQLVISNITAGAVTITIKDKQGSPLALLQAVSIPANSTQLFYFGYPVKMLGGINWVASAAASLNAVVNGFRLP